MNWLAKILVINVALSLSVLSPELVKASEQCELEIGALKRDVADGYEKLDVLKAEVATAKKCVTDFDFYTENEVKFKELTVQLDGLSADLATLKFLLGEQIKELENNLPDTSKVAKEQQDATNQIKLAELLKQRMEISSWPLRSSDNVTVIYTNIQELESQIADLRKTLADVKTWPSEDLLKQLIDEQFLQNQKLSVLQSELAKIIEELRLYDDVREFAENGEQKIVAIKAAVEDLKSEIRSFQNDIASAKNKLASANDRLDAAKSNFDAAQKAVEDIRTLQSDATSELAKAQVTKRTLEPELAELVVQEDNITQDLEILAPQASATKGILKDYDAKIATSTEKLKTLKEELQYLEKLEAELNARIAQSNQNLTKITNTIKTEYKDNDSFEQIKNQVFALKLTVESLGDRALDLDDNISAAEGKLSRFERACRRKPACKDAVY